MIKVLDKLKQYVPEAIPDIVFRKELTPEVAAEELWATYLALQTMKDLREQHVTLGLKGHRETITDITKRIELAEIYTFDSGLLRANTSVFDTATCLKKWRGKYVEKRMLPTSPVFALLDVNLRLIDFTADPAACRKSKEDDMLLSSILIDTKQFLIEGHEDSEVFGMVGYFICVHPQSARFQVVCQPLTLCVNDTGIPALNRPIMYKSQALCMELIDFAQQKIVQKTKASPSDESVRNYANATRRHDLFIPTIQVVSLRKVETDTTRDYHGRDISFAQSVKGHWRTLRSGKTIQVKPHKRYSELPDRPQPRATVHAVCR